MEEYVTRLEYDEHNRRTDDEHRRTNELTVSVGNLAAKQEDMVTRVDAIEKEPAKNWSTLKTGILSAIAAAIGSGLVAAVVSFIR